MDEPTIIPLKTSKKEVETPQKQIIIPLHITKSDETQPQQKEVSIQEYVDLKCQDLGGKLVGFLTNWVQTTFVSNLMEWLRSDFKNEIKQEIIKELKACN